MPWRRKGQRQGEGPTPDSRNPELRMMALNIVPSEVGLHPSPELPTVFGGVMDIAMPEPAMVVFYALTRSGRRRAEVSMDALVSERHPLSPLFVLGNRVITAARVSDGWSQER